MVPALLLSLCALLAGDGLRPPSAASPGAPPLPSPPGEDAEFDRRLREAGDDARALWELVLWCEDTDREKAARTALRKLIRVHPEHRQARERLGHVQFEGEWFPSEKALEDHLARLEAARAKAEGLVRFRGDWVHPADLPMLEEGLVRGPQGRWITLEEERRLEAGWALQDLTWVPPDEVENIEQGLWKCGDRWLPLEEADEFHSRLERPWVIPAPFVTLRTTCERAVAERALVEMEKAHRVMTRLWGAAPREPYRVVLARSLQQLLSYLNAPIHPPFARRELLRVLRVTFAEGWHDESERAWQGAGTAFWNAGSDSGDSFGVHDARMAAGLAFSEAMDPSTRAVGRLEDRGWKEGFAADYWREKELPGWWRWGTACYASRYFEDLVERGGDPWWARKWSVENLNREGGLPTLDLVWEFELDADDPDSSRLVNAAGLVVAFIVDGDCGPVRELHAELQETVRAGKVPGKILAKLRKSVEAHEDELRAFAGL